MWRPAAIAVAALLAAPAAAEGPSSSWTTGSELRTTCEAAALGPCLGYAVAIADVMVNGNTITSWRACIPEAATTGQLKDIAVRYLRDHPDERHYGAASLVAAAFAQAFPCKP